MAEPFQHFRRRVFPHPALDGLQQPFHDAAQRPRVALPEKFLHLRVEDVFLGYILIHPVLNDLRRGVVAEHIVHGGGQLESAFVAVPLH